MPTPRLSTSLRQNNTDKPQDGRITRETVVGIGGQDGETAPVGRYKVLDVWIPGRDANTLEIGDVVNVQWKDGKPYRIVDFEVRRGSTRAQGGIVEKGIVEQLFLAPSKAPGGKKTVYFRNHNQITELKYDTAPFNRIYADWTNAVQKVFWGANNDIFAVLEGTGAAANRRYHVYRIKRPGNSDGNPTGGNSKIIETQKVTVKEKLYTIQVSTAPEITLSDITLELRRDSHEKWFTQVWDNGGSFFPTGPPLVTTDAITNVNVASVDRIIHLKVAGEQLNVTVDGQSGAEANITVAIANRPTVAIMSAIVNENNDLLWTLKVVCTNFAMGQGNPQTGLTGSYHRMGEGLSYPFGFFDVFRTNFRTDPDYPFELDDVGVMDFFGHGNPGGVLYTSITETHSILVNAHTGAIVESTIEPTKTLRIDEATDGAVPYIGSHYVNFSDSGLHDPLVGPDHGYAYGFHSTYQSVYGSITLYDAGNLGNYGIMRSDRSLYKATLVYAPEAGIGRSQVVTGAPTVNIGYNTERTDGWDTVNGRSGFFTGSNRCVESHWVNPTSSVEHRYEIKVETTPFYSEGGNVYSFVAVLRRPYNTPGTPNTTDPQQLGVFVTVGGTSYPVLNYITAATTEMPVFSTGNKRHVIWTYGGQAYIGDYLRGIERVFSNTPAKADVLKLLNPDLLYSIDEKKRFFVKGWNRATGALTLDDLDAGYPTKDTPIGSIGTLLPLPTALVSASGKDTHAILDTTLVPLTYRPV